jgi:hypothetical protein
VVLREVAVLVLVEGMATPIDVATRRRFSFVSFRAMTTAITCRS